MSAGKVHANFPGPLDTRLMCRRVSFSCPLYVPLEYSVMVGQMLDKTRPSDKLIARV